MLVAWRITRSPFGRVCRSIQQNRARVPFLGFDPVRYRERAFVLSAGICGVAGGLSAFLFRHVAAETLRWTTTGQAVLMTMLGGLNSFFGPAAGAVSVKFLEAISLNPGGDQAVRPGVIGAVFAIFVLVAPAAGPAWRPGSAAWSRRPAAAGGSVGVTPARGAPGAEVSPGPGVPVSAAAPALRTAGLTKSFRGLEVLRGVDLSVTTGTLHAVIGPNGAGKTTLFNILSGAIPPTAGRVSCGARCDRPRPHELNPARAQPVVPGDVGVPGADGGGEPDRGGHGRASPARAASCAARPGRAPWPDRVGDLMGQLGSPGCATSEAGVLSHGDQRRLDLGLRRWRRSRRSSSSTSRPPA